MIAAAEPTASSPAQHIAQRPSQAALSPRLARLCLLLVIAAAFAAGFLLTAAPAPITAADADLARLLRAMTGLKALMAAAVSAAVLWRLASPVSPGWLLAYAAALAAAWAGPGLIWTMAHVGAGALLLHGGMAAGLLLLWRDPATARRIAAAVAARRARYRPPST